MAIVHIVLLEFKPDTPLDKINDVCRGMLALKDSCISPKTSKPYITTAAGGKNVPPAGITRGFSYAFVMQFDNEEDKNYYLEKDPAHLEFGKSLHELVEKFDVLDFTPGVF